MKYRKYMKYVGQYVKRFYTSFTEENIWNIGDYREVIYFENEQPLKPRAEFHYWKGQQEFWADVEDSVIITNEEIISDDERVANVDHPDYKGYSPFAQQTEDEHTNGEDIKVLNLSDKIFTLEDMKKALDESKEINKYNYPFQSGVSEIDYRNKLIELICDKILSYNGKGIFNSEKLQKISDIVFNKKQHIKEIEALKENLGNVQMCLEIEERRSRQSKEIELPSDEELEKELHKLPYQKYIDDGMFNDGQISGFEDGAKWMREEIRKQLTNNK